MDSDTSIEVGELSPEQIEKIKAAAEKRVEEAKCKAVDDEPNDVGEPATQEEARDAKPLPQSRKVVLNKFMYIDVYKGDEVVNTLKPDRNILEALIVLKTLDMDTVVSIYVTEDEKLSDPLPDGQETPEYPLFNITKKTVKEAGEILVSQAIPDQGCIIEFQNLCEFMSFRSSLMAANVVFVFKGGRAGGFSYFSSCADVPDSDTLALYNAAVEQNKQYKAKLKEVRPQIRFEDDTNIITHL